MLTVVQPIPIYWISRDAQLVKQRHFNDRWLLIPGAVTVFIISFTYITVFSFPGHYGGLFLDMAASLSEHNLRYVPVIDGYTANGVPFGYPPVGLLLLVGGLELGADVATIYWAVPLGLYVAAVYPTYRLAVELTGSQPAGALGTVFVLSSPEVFKPLIVATGVTRAPAYLFSVAGLLVGIHLFREGGIRWVLAGGVLFGLTGASHPVYATFYGLSYLLLWGVYDRSVRGIVTGAGVGVIGLAVMAPWLASVIANHGVDIFVQTSQVRGGVGPDPIRLALYFYKPHVPVIALTQALGIIGLIWLSLRRELLIPALFIWIAILFPHTRFLFFFSAIAAAWFTVAVIVPSMSEAVDSTRLNDLLGARLATQIKRYIPVFVIAMLAVYSVSAGAGFLIVDNERIETISADDREAMEWMSANTQEDAAVLVIGEGSEWLPWFANRTTLVTPMGSEWKGNPAFSRQMRLRNHLHNCKQTRCVESVIQSLSVKPDYVYVQADHQLVASALLNESEYRIVYRKDGIMIFRIGEDAEMDSYTEKPRRID